MHRPRPPCVEAVHDAGQRVADGVLVVTGQSDRANDAVIEAYADEFMSKPIGFKQLVSWVQARLDTTA